MEGEEEDNDDDEEGFDTKDADQIENTMINNNPILPSDMNLENLMSMLAPLNKPLLICISPLSHFHSASS